MGTHNSAVGHNSCHVGVLLRKVMEHICPDTVLLPTGVALEDAVPLVELFWQFTPLGAQCARSSLLIQRNADTLPHRKDRSLGQHRLGCGERRDSARWTFRSCPTPARSHPLLCFVGPRRQRHVVDQDQKFPPAV